MGILSRIKLALKNEKRILQLIENYKKNTYIPTDFENVFYCEEISGCPICGSDIGCIKTIKPCLMYTFYCWECEWHFVDKGDN